MDLPFKYLSILPLSPCKLFKSSTPPLARSSMQVLYVGVQKPSCICFDHSSSSHHPTALDFEYRQKKEQPIPIHYFHASPYFFFHLYYPHPKSFLLQESKCAQSFLMQKPLLGPTSKEQDFLTLLYLPFCIPLPIIKGYYFITYYISFVFLMAIY